MRVLVVTNLYPSEAAPAQGTFVRQQVMGLRREGVDVELLHVDRARGGRKVYRGLRRALRRKLAERRVDVVHVMYGGVMADIVTRSVGGTPVVVTYYGSDLLGALARTRGFTRLSALYGVRASRRAAARAAAVVVQSPVLAAALPGSVKSAHVHVVADGIDFELFRPLDPLECRRRIGWDQAREHILFPAARHRPEKQFELASAAVELLQNAGRRVELHELVGVGHEEVPLWLNASDLVVLTSTHEGSPNVVKEALACDVAVVSVDVGDVRQLVDPIEGCFIADRDPADLAAKIAAALDRRERVRSREQIGHLSVDRVARRLRDIYVAVANASAATSGRGR